DKAARSATVHIFAASAAQKSKMRQIPGLAFHCPVSIPHVRYPTHPPPELPMAFAEKEKAREQCPATTSLSTIMTCASRKSCFRTPTSRQRRNTQMLSKD